MADVGRNSKYTPEMVDKICFNLEKGLPYTTACALSGVSFETFNNWRKDPAKLEFFERIKEAESVAEARLVERIQVAGEEQWQANAWMLERRHPDHWGKVERIKQEVSGPEGSPIKQEVAVSITDKLAKYKDLFNDESDKQ